MNNIPQIMSGVYLTGHGGLDKLVYREDIPVPVPQAGEVLIEVKGAGVNNTDINTRLGWYSKKVTSDTNAGGREGLQEVDNDDACHRLEYGLGKLVQRSALKRPLRRLSETIHKFNPF